MPVNQLAARIRPALSRAASGPAFWIALSISAVAGCALVSIALGGDANWDLKNYHLYAALADHTGNDHHPAGIQSHLNPTLDLLLTRPLLEHGSLLLLSAVLGGLQGLNFVVLTAIAYQLLRGDDDRTLLALLAAFLGLTGAIVVAEIGTTLGDLTTALLVLGAFFCCLRALSDDGRSAVSRWTALGGFAIGIAVGLKLGNAVFLVALVGAMLLAGGARRLRAALLVAFAAACAIALVQGWWSWRVWQAFGNPVFPFFNGVFQSPFYPSMSFRDLRFMPRSWPQALFYPFYFCCNHQTAEVAFRDYRFPIAFALAAMLPFAAWSTPSGATIRSRGILLLTAFVVLSYVVWEAVFSIARYAIVLELLLPTFSLIVLLRLSPRHGRLVFVAVALALALTTRPADWGRLDAATASRPIVDDVLLDRLGSMLDGAAVVLGPLPLAYLAGILRDRDIAWIGPDFTPADARVAAAKLARRPRAFAIARASPADLESVDRRLRALGLPGIDATRCSEFATTLDEKLALCEVDAGAARPATLSNR